MRNSPLRAFASPLKQDKKDKSKKASLSRVANFINKQITLDSTTVKKMKKQITSKPKGKDKMSSLLDDF